MRQIAIFQEEGRSSSFELEARVNQWIKEDNIQVIDIEFGYGAEKDDYCNSFAICVVYEV